MAAPSNAYGTSTPGTLCPSERTYSTWYCVSVMKLFEVGAFGDVDEPGSLRASLNAACPGSVKIVGTWFTTVMTSELTTVPNVPGLAPDAPSSVVSNRYDDVCPWRV